MNSISPKISRIWLTIISLTFATSIAGYAQNNTSSPYSMYGLGELRLQTNPHNSAMGSTGIGMFSDNFLNTINPASYSGIDSMTFIFELGADGKYSSFKSKTKAATTNDANFSYLATGWRITPWLSSGFGLNPFSSTGYQINTTSLIEGIQQEYPLDIIGSGDLSRAYLSTSVLLAKKLSLGVKSSFLFGNQMQSQAHDLTELGSNSIYNQTTDYFNNFYFEFGLLYKLNLKNKDALTLGAIYNPRQVLQTKRLNNTYNSIGSVLQYEEESTGEFVVPEEYGIGFTYQRKEHFTLAVDLGTQLWSNETYDISGVELKNNPYLSVGVDVSPSSNVYTDYYKRISYRAGFRLAQSYLKLRDTDLYETTFSLGLGLPVKKNKSRIDLSLEWGRNGTLSKNLIREDFVRFRLGFSLKETWFIKRRFD